jgi:hypothetical protein
MNSKLFVNFSENIQSKYAFYMLVQLEEKKLTENVVNVLCIYSSVIKKKLQLALLLKKMRSLETKCDKNGSCMLQKVVCLVTV